KQFFDSALEGTKLRKVAPPAKSVEKTSEPQTDLDQETAVSLLGWKQPLDSRQQENLKVLFSCFKPRPNQPTDLFIPISEARRFIPRLRKKSKQAWTRNLLLKEYRKWKSST